jgi:predicted nuclease of predicted toxin-antitoxin system
MPISLLLDANLSWRSVSVLKNHYADCIHIDSAGLLRPAKDMEIWEYARNRNMLIVTNDEDFLHLSTIKGFPPKVLLFRTGNQSRKFVEESLINLKETIELFFTSADQGILELI